MAIRKYLDEKGLEVLIKKIKEMHSTILEFKGSVGVKSTDPKDADYKIPDLPTTDLRVGDVYNVTEDFITDDNFIEGAGKEHTAGSNVAIVNVGTPEAPVLKWDVYGNDLAAYQTKRLQDAYTALAVKETTSEVPDASDTSYALNDLVMVESTDKAVAGIYRCTAIDDDGNRTWSGPFGDESTIEGYIKFFGSVCANTPITADEIEDLFTEV